MTRGRWRDAWLGPGAELLVGCILLMISVYWFWESAGAIWQTWRAGFGTVAVVLGPWFVYRRASRADFLIASL